MRKRAITVAICMAASVIYAAVANAGTGDAFVTQCQQTVQGIKESLPQSIDASSVCRCQANKLAARGYAPDKFRETALELFNKTMTDEGGSAPDKKTLMDARTKYVRMMQASGAAFSDCLPNRGMESMQKAIDNIKKPRAERGGPNTGDRK